MNGTGKLDLSCAETVPSRRAVRNKVGAESREGRLLSNLDAQQPWLNDRTGDETGGRPWATHETQNVPWMMDWQRKCLTKGA